MVLGLEIKMTKWFLFLKWFFTTSALIGIEFLWLFVDVHLETYLLAITGALAAGLMWYYQLYYSE